MANDWPSNHVEISEDNLAWLASGGESADLIIRIERLRREHPEAYLAIHAAMETKIKRKILVSLVAEERPLTYDELTTRCPNTSKRSVRRHVTDLKEDGVLAVEGRPAYVSWESDAIRMVGRHSVTFFFSS